MTDFASSRKIDSISLPSDSKSGMEPRSIEDIIKNYVPTESRIFFETTFNYPFSELKFKSYDSKGIVLTCKNKNPWQPISPFLFHSPRTEEYKRGVLVSKIEGVALEKNKGIPLRVVEQLGSNKIIGTKVKNLSKFLIIRVHTLKHTNGHVVVLANEIKAGRLRYSKLDWLAKNGLEYFTGDESPFNPERCNVNVDHDWIVIEILGFY